MSRFSSTSSASTGRPKKDAQKRPITVAWRMMWVAAVTLNDRNGDALHTIRYGAMPDDGCESLLHGAAGDVNELLRKRPRPQGLLAERRRS